MAEEYTNIVEERIFKSTWAHERSHTGKTIGNIWRDFTLRFNKAGTPETTIPWRMKKLFETGSIKNSPRPKRPSTRTENYVDVHASVERLPKKSLRKRPQELGVPVTTMRTHMKSVKSLRMFLVLFSVCGLSWVHIYCFFHDVSGLISHFSQGCIDWSGKTLINVPQFHFSFLGGLLKHSVYIAGRPLASITILV